MIRSRFRQKVHAASPGTRLAIRWMTLLMLLGFAYWAMHRLDRPKAWRWWGQLTTPSGAIDAAPSGPRQAPFPDLDLLRKVEDGTPFGVENDRLLLPSEVNERHRIDADARYHLLFLASMAPGASLLHDARPSVTYEQLLADPAANRGEVVRFQGELLSWSKIPLKRSEIPGQSHAYQAWVILEQPQQRICYLFSELPEGWRETPVPSQELLGVAIAGYFLKGLKVEHPQQPNQSVIVPVVVGKRLHLLPGVEAAAGGIQLPWLFFWMALPVALLMLLAWSWYVREDRSLRQRLALVESRRHALDLESIEQLEKNAQEDHPTSVPEPEAQAKPDSMTDGSSL